MKEYEKKEPKGMRVAKTVRLKISGLTQINIRKAIKGS